MSIVPENMTVEKALKELGIESLSNISSDLIKKHWRSRMKVVHPDKAGRDIELANRLQIEAKKANEAYSLLLKLCDTLKLDRWTDNSEVCVIDIFALGDLYSGKEFISNMTINGTEKKIKLNKANIRAKRVIVQIPFTIRLNDMTYHEIRWCNWNMKDEYIINMNINSSDVLSTQEIKVNISDKEIKYNMSGKLVELNFKFEHGIKVVIRVERVKQTDG